MMENKRQLIHIGMAGFALLLAFLTRPQALACTAAAFAFNWLVMPRIGKSTFREEEKHKGYSTGMLMYCASVFLLILIFPAHVAAGAWAVMAFGDGFASLIGKRYGQKKLGWNRNKSWAGFLAFVAAGTMGAFLIQLFIDYYKNDLLSMMPAAQFYGGLLFTCALAALCAATIESLDIKLNDNLSVPLVAGIMLWLLWNAWVMNPLPFFPGRILPALAVSLLIGGVSYATKAVDGWGLAGGIGIGFGMYYFADWQGFTLLLVFFIIGTACTKAGRRIKERRGVAQENKGRRGLKNALANCFPGLLFAYVLAADPVAFLISGLCAGLCVFPMKLAVAGAFAAALADTVSSEIGQLSKAQPVMITTFRKVAPGTNGGITLLGTLAGACGALLVGLAALASEFVTLQFLWIPVAAGIFGMTIDSLLGAMLEDRGLVNNEFVNFCCTLSGGIFAALAPMAVLDTKLFQLILRIW